MDVNLLREVVTVLSFAAFLGVVVYAVHPRNGKRFEEAARLPLEDEDTLTPALSTDRERNRRPTPHPGPLPEGRGRRT